MLHEILLSLAGNSSPLLRPGHTPPVGDSVISPPERELLASVAHLSDLHVKLLSNTAHISSHHGSMICRAVASAIDSTYLRAFQQKVLQVEDSILRKDAGLVGAYNIVPLTAVVGEFSDWTRRMEWLWDVVQFMLKPGRRGVDRIAFCTGGQLIDRLRNELQSGYADIEETARSLVRVAEVAWLKHISAWILYGRLPSFGETDFFVQRSEDDEEVYTCSQSLLPSFVTTATAESMLFIGTSLVHIRAKSSMDSSLYASDHLSSQLHKLSQLTLPLESASLARTVTEIRSFLSRTTLQKLLPLAKVMEMLQLFRDFFLLGRGEFAMALMQQADQKIRSRWTRADNPGLDKKKASRTVMVNEGEVAGVLTATWAALGSMQGQQSDEDEGLELARDLLRLTLTNSKSSSVRKPSSSTISSTPFQNLLFSVPVVLTLEIPAPLDLFLSQADLQTYVSINSYLLSIRRAHLRLTDLWKVSALRRHYPPPPGPPYGSTRNGRSRVQTLRRRHTARSNTMRSAWATSSAAIFFLAETEGYLQTEVVAGLWDGFQRWLLTGSDDAPPKGATKSSKPPLQEPESDDGDEDIWLAVDTPKVELESDHELREQHRPLHDPQTLAIAHRRYLRTLTRRLLLTQQAFTDQLYELLVQIDHLVALVHRLHAIWTSMDLEADVGVVDDLVDLETEEDDVKRDIKNVEARVRKGVEAAVVRLRDSEGTAFMGKTDLAIDGVVDEATDEMEDLALELRDAGQYVPRRVGGLDRLLMKLDFGTWIDSGRGRVDLEGDEDA